MSNMQIAKRNLASKTRALSTFARNTSCSRGWLRVVVQTIFALITVISFILIIHLALQNTPSYDKDRPRPHSRCNVNNCKVSCRNAPYFDNYEDHIIQAITEAEINCERISLVLTAPFFVNSTMPAYWMSKLRTDKIHELVIGQGNLMHLAPEAFMGQFARNIQLVILHDVTIQTWCDLSLVGLFSLKNLFIKKCNITGINAGAMRAVDNTLETLTITLSDHWNPINVTGTADFEQITSVDFSFNNFGNVLNNESFVGLENCKFLYLTSCRITAIGPGTFDHLHSIDIIYLNNNLLVTLPPGLFDNIMSVIPKPRINLQNNLWYCNCKFNDLRLLVTNNLLYVEPLCYEPKYFRGKTFTAFENICHYTDISITNRDSCNSTYETSKNNVYLNATCSNQGVEKNSSSFKILSPLLRHKCSTQAMKNAHMIHVVSKSDLDLTENKFLKLNFFLMTEKYSVIQMDSTGSNGYGIVWYQSTCPHEIYCLSILPEYLIVYNIDFNARYTFCPVESKSGLVEVDHCLSYNMSKFEMKVQTEALQILFYMSTGLVCLVFGALCVYALIRKNPSLLKGSKRILFVKHKTVDALVLPPKVPLRSSLETVNSPEVNDNNIFIVSKDKLNRKKFNTVKSVKSENSDSPSYVSALQPTEDQLAEWRIHHHFNNDLTLTSSSDVSLFSWLYKEPIYYSLESDHDITYESLK